MRSIDSNTLTALEAGGLELRQFVYVRGWDSEGDPATFGYWNGIGTVSVSVISAVSGSTESRTYAGDGSLLKTDDIVSAMGLEVRNVNVVLSQLHATVAGMAFGSDVRLAEVEIHRGLFGLETGQLVAAPVPVFLGTVDALKANTPQPGGTAQLVLGCVSDTRALTRVNTARKSDVSQQLRSGDRYRRYVGVAKEVDTKWGEA